MNNQSSRSTISINLDEGIPLGRDLKSIHHSFFITEDAELPEYDYCSLLEVSK